MDSRQADMVARSLGDLLMALGVTGAMPLTGPELLMAADQVTADLQCGRVALRVIENRTFENAL